MCSNMKERVRNVLLQFIDENIDICCLCLKVVEICDKIKFEDEIILEFHDDETLRMRDMLSHVFGDTVVDQLSSLGIICQDCSSLAANSYKFIKESKKNAEYRCHILQHIETLFDDTPLKLGEFKSLYLSLELKPELVTNQIFDIVDVNSNITKAIKRFNKITEPKSQFHSERKSIQIKQETEPDKKTARIKIGKEKCAALKPQISNTLATKKACVDKFYQPVSKTYICLECDSKFESASLLKNHKRQKHTNLKCSECGKEFKHLQTLKAHINGHYSKYICQKCGRSYKNLTTLRLHYENNVCESVTRHTPATAKYTCDYCNKKYTQKMSLRVHIQYEHLNYKSHPCKWCKKKFWCKSRLEAHIVKHTKEKKFLCVTCHKNFVSKESLLYHTRIHTGERPYDCPYCDGKFLSASRRTNHIRNQHKDPRVQCDTKNQQSKAHNYMQKNTRSCLQKPQTQASYNIADISEIVEPVMYHNDQTQFVVQENVKHYKDQREIQIRMQNKHLRIENNADMVFQMEDTSGDYVINVCENVQV